MKKQTTSKRKEIERSQFIESVYHIIFMGNIARNFEYTLSTVGDKINEIEKMTVRYSFQWNIMVTTISLLDELEKYFFEYGNSSSTDNETKEKIGSYKYIVEPILNDIKEWSDFRKFRNNVLAHNFRIDSDNFKSVHLSNELHNYNAPEGTVDLLTLFKYINSISQVIEEMFKSEYEEAKAIMNSFNNPKKKLTTQEEGLNKVNTALLDVNMRINDYNERVRKLNQQI